MAEKADGLGEYAATMELLWGPPKAKTRGPKPAHSLEDLLDAAIRIADAEGLDAVSMQRVAQELGFTKMAVYRYVPGRPELVALMTDRALGLPPKPSKSKNWRKRMEVWALAVFEIFIAHPWGLEATTGQRVMGPNEMAWAEAGLEPLAETGFNGPDRLDVLAAILGHLRSAAQQMGGAGPTMGVETQMNLLTTHALDGREAEFPQFSAAIAEAAHLHAENNGLSFGINCILDGVEWQMAKRR
jgi:AcrR family transcriptional regulator